MICCIDTPQSFVVMRIEVLVALTWNLFILYKTSHYNTIYCQHYTNLCNCFFCYNEYFWILKINRYTDSKKFCGKENRLIARHTFMLAKNCRTTVGSVIKVLAIAYYEIMQKFGCCNPDSTFFKVLW